MKKVIIPTELVNQLAYDEQVQNHERKARREIRNQRIAELVNQGIEKKLATVMVDCGL